MDPLFATYLIGLREGLEAVLVVTVLIAFLVRGQQRHLLPHVWLGVGSAVVLSAAAAVLLEFTSAELSGRQEELFEGIVSLVAVIFVTWMIFWMRRTARTIAGQLRSRLAEAVEVGSYAVITVAFLAVAREGLETALLFFAADQSTANQSGSVLAVLGGLATSVVIGWLLYASAIRLNLGRFFTWTGSLLILVAAGILRYGVHELQEAGVLPGEDATAFDTSGWLDPDSWYGTVLGGMFNITGSPSWLEVAAWLGYASAVLLLFLRPIRLRRPAEAMPSATAEASTEATAEATGEAA